MSRQTKVAKMVKEAQYDSDDYNSEDSNHDEDFTDGIHITNSNRPIRTYRQPR